MNCCRARPAKPRESGRVGSTRSHLEPDLEDSIEGLRTRPPRDDSATKFDPRVVNAACREITDIALPGNISDGRRGKNEIESKGSASDHAPWWKLQLNENLTEAQLEAQERMMRRTMAKARADEEQHRRTIEAESGAMEDEWERRRRREFAKQTLVEEQHRRAWLVDVWEEEQEKERHRRHEAAVQACLAEEVRRTEVRLTLREFELQRIPETAAIRRLADEAHQRRLWARRQRALFLAGVRVRVQFIRFMEGQADAGHAVAGSAAWRDAARARSAVDQAVLDLYTRDCLDPRSRPRLASDLAAHANALPSPSTTRPREPALRAALPVRPTPVQSPHGAGRPGAPPGGHRGGRGEAGAAAGSTGPRQGSLEVSGAGGGGGADALGSMGGGVLWPLATRVPLKAPPAVFRPMPRVAAANVA